MMMSQIRQSSKLQGNAPVPIYYQLQELILKDIENGTLLPGAMIPTEQQLVQSYGVSIGTVKKAVLNLVNQGYLYRIQGKGTFVTGTTLRRESLRYYRLLDSFESHESNLAVKPLGIRKVPGFIPANRYLKIRADQSLFELKRIFLMDGATTVFSISYLPQGLFKKLSDYPCVEFEKKPLYATIEEKYGIPTIRNHELISACFPDAEAASVLGIPTNTPVLYQEMLAFTYRNRPYEYRRAYCITNPKKIFREY
jgi:GntR family transcriptional regulator